MKKSNDFLFINHQKKINYIYMEPKVDLPIVVFLHGYKSDIKGKKAQYLYDYCLKRGLGFLTFEYRGHGESSGRIYDFTLKDWVNDVEVTINNLVKDKKKILIGSSLGGWLAFLYAVKFPDMVNSIIGIAPALDFLEDLVQNKYNVLIEPIDSQFIKVKYKSGSIGEFNKNLLSDYKEYLLLQSPFINLEMPIRLLHGIKDDIVPYHKSLLISEKILSEDVIVTLLKNGDHSLSTPENLELLANNLESLLIKY